LTKIYPKPRLPNASKSFSKKPDAAQAKGKTIKGKLKSVRNIFLTLFFLVSDC
jgi:hypothetical protein